MPCYLCDRILSGGLVQTLPPDLFTGLTNVRTLTLREFFVLDTLPADVFASMTTLSSLSLWNFGVKSIHVNAFRGLSGLQSLCVAAHSPCRAARSGTHTPHKCSLTPRLYTSNGAPCLAAAQVGPPELC